MKGKFTCEKLARDWVCKELVINIEPPLKFGVVYKLGNSVVWQFGDGVVLDNVVGTRYKFFCGRQFMRKACKTWGAEMDLT